MNKDRTRLPLSETEIDRRKIEYRALAQMAPTEETGSELSRVADRYARLAATGEDGERRKRVRRRSDA
jgi:hypothetical protein